MQGNMRDEYIAPILVRRSSWEAVVSSRVPELQATADTEQTRNPLLTRVTGYILGIILQPYSHVPSLCITISKMDPVRTQELNTVINNPTERPYKVGKTP